jgi:hypothetical protein
MMARAAPWLVILALALAYPVVTLATGQPSFPTRDDCVQPATSDGDIDAVFGYFDDERAAIQMRDRALAVGFEGTSLAWNACGRIRVAVGGISTLDVGREFLEQARGAGFEVTLEQAS